MRTEQRLRDALHALVEAAPDADDVLDRLHWPASAPSRSPKWRPALIAAIVGLTVVLVGAIVVPYLTRQSAPDPADPRLPGSWTMVSHIEPPPGWSPESREISRNFETTVISDPTGKGVCRVETDRRGVAPQRPISSLTEPATVGTNPASYQVTQDGSAVYWHYDTDAWASVSCRMGPKGLGAARTPQQIRDLIISLADTVTFGEYPLRLPIRIEQLPTGYSVQSTQQDAIPSQDWGITLSPTRTSPTLPNITISLDNRNTYEVNTRVGKYRASFFTDQIHGPYSPVPRTEVSYTSLCIPSAPVGICISATNTATDDPESRRDLFHSLASQITYAASPTDTGTWFDASSALPS